MRKEELVGRRGKQPDGSAKTREVKLVTIWSAEGQDNKGTPVRDADSISISCTSTGGVVEAGCKLAIGTRCKRAGMHWTVAGVDAIIALRCCKLSGRFEGFRDRRAQRRRVIIPDVRPFGVGAREGVRNAMETRHGIMKEIPGQLEVEPELRFHAEQSLESKRGVRAHPTFAMDELIDSWVRNAQLLGQLGLGEAERFQELLE